MNADEYARMHALETEYWWFAGRRALIAQLLRHSNSRDSPTTPNRKAIRLLDIGCGTGANLPMLREFVGEVGSVTAVDFSPLALQFARAHEGSRGVPLLRGDAVHLPFPDDSFDVVTLLDVLEHLRDDGAALREIARVLRVGGKVVLSVPAYQHLWSAHDEALHHFRRYEKHNLRRVLRQAGFCVPLLSFAMSVMPPLAWLWRRVILPFQPNRPRDAKRHSQGAVLPNIPRFGNRALTRYLKFEGRLITRRPLRFGTSLVAVAVKQSHGSTQNGKD